MRPCIATSSSMQTVRSYPKVSAVVRVERASPSRRQRSGGSARLGHGAYPVTGRYSLGHHSAPLGWVACALLPGAGLNVSLSTPTEACSCSAHLAKRLHRRRMRRGWSATFVSRGSRRGNAALRNRPCRFLGSVERSKQHTKRVFLPLQRQARAVTSILEREPRNTELARLQQNPYVCLRRRRLDKTESG